MNSPKPPKGSLDKAALLRLASLARVALRDEEVAPLSAQLSEIVAYVELLSGVDTEGVEPLIHPNPEVTPPRPDVVREGIGPRGIAQAAAQQEEQVRVPRIIE